MPEISMIIPVYGTEQQLPRCIDSVLAQTFSDFELILVEDGSPDNCARICDEYASRDGRINVIHQQNMGVSSARNRGLDAASGRYISFIDSDDYIEDDFLEALYSGVTKASADMMTCNTLERIKTGEWIGMDHLYPEGEILDKKGIRDVFVRNVFYTKHMVGYFSLCNKLLKRSIIEENGIRFDTAMSRGEDMLFILEYVSHCDSIAFTRRYLYRTERLPGGLSSRYRRGETEDSVKRFNALMKYTRPEGVPEEDTVYLRLKVLSSVDHSVAGVIANEKHINREIRRILTVPGLREIIAPLADAPAVPQDRRILPRLLSEGRITRAVWEIRYRLDDGLIFKRVDRRLKILLRRSDK